MTNRAVDTKNHNIFARLGAVLLHEFHLVVPPTVFFFFGFNLILLTKRLFLADYLIAYAGFLIATTSALIVGKVVLVAGKLPLLSRLDGKPLVYPILFKAFVYTSLVFIARMLEALIHFLIEEGWIGHDAFIRHELGTFSWPHFIAVQLWIFVLFVVYVAITELNKVFGEGKLYKIFFKRSATGQMPLQAATQPTRSTMMNDAQ